MKINGIFLLFLTVFYSNFVFGFLPQNQKIYVYTNNSSHYATLKDSFDKHNIKFKVVKSINKKNKNLYILFDVHTIEKSKLPDNYIVYQTLDLANNALTEDYIDQLSQAIVVWDPSLENISRYQRIIKHYHYFPKDYEFADPIILPCFLPTLAFKDYKEFVRYENTTNSDISSHLPTLLCYSTLQNPELILELGVRGGESTAVFSRVLGLCNAQLLGVDIDPASIRVYSNISNALFLHMNDLDFVQYFQNSAYKDKKIDVIFIDTSHLYEHTMQEIKQFVPLLNEGGIMVFHDSNITPSHNNTTYYRYDKTSVMRLNGTSGYSVGGVRGVTQALKEYFSIAFDEHQYVNTTFIKDEISWHMVHYPFCNGLTILKKGKKYFETK